MHIKQLARSLVSIVATASFSVPTMVLAAGPVDGEYRMPEPGFNAPLAFKPAEDVRVERQLIMRSEGYDTGTMHSVRIVEDGPSGPVVRDDVSSELNLGLTIKVETEETLWIGPKGLQRYYGVYDETWKSDQMIIGARLNGDVLEFDFKAHGEETPVRHEFVRNQDYHWVSTYFELRNRELAPGKLYNRRLLDTIVGQTKPLKEKYLGMRYYEVGDQVLDCHVIWFDYGHVNGTIWVAEDELGPFLVYEEAMATEGPFELFLTEYTKTNIEKK